MKPDSPIGDEPLVTLRKLYPHLTDEELKAVDERWERYLALVVRITLRLRAERAAAVDRRVDAE